MRRPLKPNRTRNRRGSLLVLAGGAFAVVAILGGVSINLAYIEAVETEQRLATDAAAKAASITLGKTQSVAQARAKAKEIAGKHLVAGKPFVLSDANIAFGRSTRGSGGKFSFTKYADTEKNLNSAKVTSNLSHLGSKGASVLVLASTFSENRFNPVREATATQIDMDVALVLDRSGSMAWDLSNVEFQYPGQSGRAAMNQKYGEKPHATLSRWAALQSSVNVFVNVLKDSPYQPRVSLSTYSSNFNFGVWSSTVATQDIPLTNNFDSFSTVMTNYGKNPLIGNTNIAAGLREGINSLTDPSKSRVTATKVIVLLSDGIKTQGDDPVELANTARSMNIKVCTIAFSAQADVALMKNVAAAGGGQFYNAPTAAQLETVFREIAETLPAMLTQ
jgi:Ca-activated chloride channel homolog